MSDLRDRINKLEVEIREDAAKLRNVYDGYPSTETQFDFFQKQIAALNSKLELRAGLKGIEATS